MVRVTREQSQSPGVKRRRRGLSLRRKLYFSAVSCFAFFALAEGAAWIADSRYNFRDAVLEALDDGKGTDGPISAMSDAELGWPPRTIQIRVPFRGKLPDRPYVVGHRVIPNSHWGVESSHEGVTPQNFKNRDTKRIFVFGGSAAFGFPYKYEDTFVSVLHGLLRPDGYVVLNCAECAAPSGKLVPMLARVVEFFEPDTVIIFAGNNEWIRYAMPGVPYQRELDETWINQSYHLLWQSLCHSRAVAALQVLALERTVERQLDARGPPDGRTPHLVDMKYALEHPLEAYTQFGPNEWLNVKQDYLAVFEDNLSQMVRSAHRRNVRVILVTMPFNYKLCPAWACPQPESFNPEHRDVVRRNIAATAQQISQRQYRRALQVVDETLKLDSRSPIVHYLRGHCLEALKRNSEAEAAYAACRENMIGHLGSRQSINESIKKIATNLGAELLDARLLFDEYQHDLGKYFNDELFHDDCHPTPLGHRLIAQSLAEAVWKRDKGYTPSR